MSAAPEQPYHDIPNSAKTHSIMMRMGLINEGIKHMNDHRYINIVPFDQNVVKCSLGYVNMSTVTFPNGTRYLIAQAPLQHTQEQFWQAAIENNVSTIACLTPYGDACIDYTSSPSLQRRIVSQTKNERFVIRKMEIDQPDKSKRHITQLQMLVWPNYGIPHVNDLTSFVKLVDEQWNTAGGDLLVHCSGGVGRSGTFVATHYCWKTFTGSKDLNEHVRDAVLTLRRQRHPWCVEGEAQYDLIAETVLKLVGD